MQRIEEELKRVQLLQEQIGIEFITSQKYKDQREWYTLGHFANLLKKCKDDYPVYAIKTNPSDPDFITYAKHRNKFKSIEIVEILAPNRERTKEYIESAKLIEHQWKLIELLDNPWSTFISTLNGKFLKLYGTNCWLVIYHDISYSQITLFGFWHNTLLANVKKWIESKKVDFDKCPYEKIFVIDANEKALVSIYPSLIVLVPERTSSGYTQIL
ncbi:MAG: hypothetical protein ACRDGA_09975 [Bacteroidota bacterium]